MVKWMPLFIFILALFPRMMVSLSSTEIPTSDAGGYDEQAFSIASGEGFSIAGKPTSLKPPLYPFFLAGIYSLFGHHTIAVRVIQAFLGALTCLFIFWIAKILFTEAVAILSGIIASCYPVLIKSSEHLLTECLFTFILTLAVLCFYLGKRKESVRNLMLFGFLLGMATLTRSFLLAFPFLLGLFWMGGAGWERSTLSSRLKSTFVVVGVFLLTLLPWSIRNWNVHKAFILVSADGGRAFYASYHPPEGKLFGFNPVDEVTLRGQEISSEVERNRFFYRETFRSIRNHPQEIPRLMLLKFLFFWVPFDWELIGNGVYNAMYGFMILFAMGTTVTNARSAKFMLLFVFILYFQLMALIFYGSPRIRMPIEPFLIIFASRGLIDFFNHHKHKTFTAAAMVSYFFVHVVLFIYSNPFKTFSAHLLSHVGVWR